MVLGSSSSIKLGTGVYDFKNMERLGSKTTVKPAILFLYLCCGRYVSNYDVILLSQITSLDPICGRD